VHYRHVYPAIYSKPRMKMKSVQSWYINMRKLQWYYHSQEIDASFVALASPPCPCERSAMSLVHRSVLLIPASAAGRQASDSPSRGRTGGAGSAAGCGLRAGAAVAGAAVDRRRRKVHARTSGAKTRKTRKTSYQLGRLT
jgi:hypothetical protein